MSPGVQGVVKADELCDKMKDSLIYCRKKKKKRGKNRESGILAGEEGGVGGGGVVFLTQLAEHIFPAIAQNEKVLC